MVSTTSAWLRDDLSAVPEKITSSMPPARMALADVAPITQRSASNRLDFPQPLGPTIPVRPGSMRNSVGSTKDLKPERRSLWKCTAALVAPLLVRGGDGGVEVRQGRRGGHLLAV